MGSNRRSTTVRQLEALIEFVDGHRDLALGRVRSREARALADRWWRECAELLNPLGSARTAKEWAKVWNDQKCRVRARLVSANSSHRATGGGSNNVPSLTPLESRIANIIGRDVGPLPNVRQDLFAHPGGDGLNVELEVMEEEVVIENIEEEALNLNIPHNDDIEINNSVPPTQEQSSQEELQNIELPSEAAERIIRAPRRRRAEHGSSLPSTSTQPAPSTSRPTQPSGVQASRKGLEESRAMVLRCEELRAQADLNNSQSMRIISESFRLLAESIDRFSRQFVSQQQVSPNRNEEEDNI